MSELEKQNLLLEYKVEILARVVKCLLNQSVIPKESLPVLLPSASDLGATQGAFSRDGQRMPRINDRDTAINEAREWAKDRLLR